MTTKHTASVSELPVDKHNGSASFIEFLLTVGQEITFFLLKRNKTHK